MMNDLFRKTIIGLIILFIASGTLFCSCQKTTVHDPLTVAEREWLSKHDGKIVLGHDPSASPVDFIDENGDFRGIAADYVKLMEDRLNFKFNIVHLKTWDEVVQKAKNREIDVLCTFTKNTDREKWMLFTQPYLSIPVVILTRKDNHRKLSLDHMKTMKTTFTKGWIVDDYLRKNHGHLELFPAINPNAAMNYLSTGEADAWVTALTVASNEIEKNKVTNLRIAGEVNDLFFKLAFASRKDWPILNQILEKGLQLISPNERKAIFNQWVHIESESIFKSKRFWIGIGIVATVFLLPVVLIMAWNKSLKSEVKRQTIALKHELEERKKVEENLRHSQQLNEAVLNASPDIIYLYDIVEKINVYSNEGILRVLGYSTTELKDMGEKMLEILMHPDDFQIYLTETLPKYKVLRDSEFIEHEYRMRHKDGHWCWLNSKEAIFLRKDGQPKQIFGIISDITTKKQMARESLILKAAVNQAPVGIALADENIKIYYCNPEGLGMRGGNRDDLVQIPKDAFKNWQVYMLNGEPYEIADLPLVRAINNGEIIREEFIVKHQDGTDHICDAIACPIFEDKKIIGGMVIFLDITERKKFEESLRQSEERLHLVIKGSNDAPWDWDLIKNEIYYSPQWWAQIGYSPDELPNDAALWQRIMHPEDSDRVNRFFQNALEDETQSYEVEFRLSHQKGHYIPVLSRGFITRNDSGKPIRVSGANTDLTERKRMEQALQQAQKMESIGTLAGGIAHDFNNILAVIVGNISYALSLCDKNTELSDVLSDVLQGTKQAQTLTNQLLTFSKGGEPVKKNCNVNDLLEDSIKFVTSGAKSKCNFMPTNDLWTAEIDSGQIHQVISNLIINADQAMPDGGTITVQTENIQIEIDNSFQLAAGKYIKISIEDQGVGIHEKHIAHIFEPYFTTKHKGSGLGLATAYAIVKKHGGHLTVYSEAGTGTVFNIYLPASSNSIAETIDKENPMHQGHGRILIMDDQESILKMAERMLNKMGYEVETVTDGEKAIASYREAYAAGNPFDLVILDLTVPGAMGGARTIPELLKIDPNVKAVVSSGYSNDPIMANYQDYGFCGVVPKPYTREHLSELLNKILVIKG